MDPRRLLAFGLLLILPGLGMLSLGVLVRSSAIETPVLEASDAMSHLGHEVFVTLTGRIDAKRTLYSAVPNSDPRNHSELLSGSSPIDGITLLGSDAVPQNNWPSLIGAFVTARTHARNPSQPHILGNYYRHILVRLEAQDLWALSSIRIVDEFEHINLMSEYKSWLDADTFKGILFRLRDFPEFQGARYAPVKRALYEEGLIPKPDDLDRAWLIVSGSSRIFDGKLRAATSFYGIWTGLEVSTPAEDYRVYAPFEGTNDRVWLQVPLTDHSSRFAGPITGLWLPPDNQPLNDPRREKLIPAVLVAGGEIIRDYDSSRWRSHWSWGTTVLGFGVVAVSFGLILARFVAVRSYSMAALLALAGTLAVSLFWLLRDPLITTMALAFAFVQVSLALDWLIHWRRLGHLKPFGIKQWRLWGFCWKHMSPETLTERVRQISDEAVVQGYHLPDHSAAGKATLGQELNRRGLSRFQTSDWLPPLSRSTVPPAVKRSISPARYRAIARRKGMIFYLFRLLAVPGLLFPPLFFALIPIILAGVLIGRDRSIRILLLRPFGQKQMTRSLKRVVVRYLGRIGYVYTLSDRNYRRSFFVDFLMTIGVLGYLFAPLTRTSIRIATVNTENGFIGLADYLTRKSKPSFWSLISGGQAFNIRTKHAWWKRCVHLLINSSDIIVMDVSRLGPGATWEIEQLIARKLLSKCLFIVQQDHGLEAGADGAVLAIQTEQPVFVYSGQGKFVDEEAFKQRLDARFDEALARWGRLRASSPAQSESIRV